MKGKNFYLRRQPHLGSLNPKLSSFFFKARQVFQIFAIQTEILVNFD